MSMLITGVGFTTKATDGTRCKPTYRNPWVALGGGGGGGEVVVIGLYLVSETVTDTNTWGFVGLIPGVGGH